MKYNHQKIEREWQKQWATNNFKIWTAKEQKKKSKKYILDMFPYPSGEGLHVGHLLGYIGSDILSRYYRMRGYEVLHPMGWDAFGLPAENYAIKNKIHPSIAVKGNIKRFKEQLSTPGFSYDWSREINTTDPEYYKWTQWIFLQMFKRGLAYEAELPVNWCPSDKTVLANEEVVNGCCDRCGTKVERKKLRQWVLKITAYADRLLEDLNLLDWPDKVKELQRNWIGRSEGAVISFSLKPNPYNLEPIQVFTTRPDTLAGATYIVLAPEHALVAELKIENRGEVDKYISEAKNKSDLERQENKEKTGVELKGVKVVNPLTKAKIPIWISDYVLAHYGTGAIMAVPAHDERDRAFAEKFGLPILDRPLINQGEVIKQVGGEKKINYKLRDWIFSRQRYWGEPIPMIKCEKCGVVPVPEKDLPVKLPKVKSYEPTGAGESPLANIKKWVETKCPICKGAARRETNTMPQWAGSCWYYLAYIMGQGIKKKIGPTGLQAFKKIFDYWLPVDIYIGGIEHAVLHLLYARFWHKVLYDIGVVGSKEPFQKLVNQGLMMGSDGQKMSKSKGNVINPDDTMKQFGADAMRMYEIFMGPFEDVKLWDPQGITGVIRFLERFKNYVSTQVKIKTGDKYAIKLLHRTIKKVSEDIEQFHFNTAISALMILLNEIERRPLGKEYVLMFVKILAPFAPYIAQELASQLGEEKLLDKTTWPIFNPELIVDDTFDLIVQINGKTRGKVRAWRDIDETAAKALVLNDPIVSKWFSGAQVKKIIFVKNRLISFVV